MLDLYQPPELDIVCYFPVTEPATLSAIDQASARILQAGHGPARTRSSSARCGPTRPPSGARHPAIGRDAAGARILRSVLMKPESEDYVTELHSRLEELAQG